MIHNVTMLSAVTAVAFIVTAFVGLYRKRKYWKTGGWWDAEGVPVFMLTWFAGMIAFLALGWLKNLN